MTLNPAVGVVARHTAPHEREEDLLGEDRPAQPFEVGAHHRGPDLEPLDDVGQPRQHEVDDDRRIRTDHPLDRGVADVALVPECHVLERGERMGADEAREPAYVLREHGVPLVRHRRRALLSGGEGLRRLPHLGPLQVADLDGDALTPAGHHR